MFRKLVAIAWLLATVGVGMLVSWSSLSAFAQGEGCASADYTTARQLLEEARTSLDAGDVPASVTLEAQARDELRRIFHDCAITPMLQDMGFDEATIDAVAQMPFCEYRFEATVRSGPNTGLALMGTLALMQNSPRSAVGYVYSLDETAAPIPVSVDIAEGNEVTLTFTVGEDTTIVGTGYFTANIDSCFGGIEGVFNGPTAEDVGDWIGLPCTLNPSSASCTPAVSLNPGQLPVLQPFNPVRPEPEPPMCTPIRDAACQAACGLDFNCRLNCPTVGETCS
jgi:hypothetical protein